jgi:hypothetical protein
VVYIGNRIYCTLKQLVTTLYRSLPYTDYCSQSWFSLRCLITASNSKRSSAPRRVAIISHKPPAPLTAVSRTPQTLGSLFRLLRIAVLQWWHLNPPPSGRTVSLAAGPRYMAPARTAKKTPYPEATPLLRVTQPFANNGCSTGSTVLALSKYVTIRVRRQTTENYLFVFMGAENM